MYPLVRTKLGRFAWSRTYVSHVNWCISHGLKPMHRALLSQGRMAKRPHIASRLERGRWSAGCRVHTESKFLVWAHPGLPAFRSSRVGELLTDLNNLRRIKHWFVHRPLVAAKSWIVLAKYALSTVTCRGRIRCAPLSRYWLELFLSFGIHQATGKNYRKWFSCDGEFWRSIVCCWS